MTKVDTNISWTDIKQKFRVEDDGLVHATWMMMGAGQRLI